MRAGSDPAGADGCPGRASGKPCCGSCAARTWRRSRARWGVTAATLAGWRDASLAGGEAALATKPADARDLEVDRLRAKLGETVLERELLAEKVAALEAGRPLARRRSRR